MGGESRSLTVTITAVTPRSALMGLTLAILSAVCFGSAGPVTKALSLAGITSLQITQGRMTIAAILLLLLVLMRDPRQLIVARTEWVMMFGFGMLAFCMNQTLYTISISRVPVGIALLLEYLAPVLIVLWIRFVRRSYLSKMTWVGVGSVLVGLCFVGEVWSEFRLDTIGVMAGIGTAIALAARFLLAERGLRSREPAALAALGAMIGAVALNIIGSPMSFPWQFAWHHASFIGGIEIPIWMLFAWLAVVSTVLAYLTGVSAQKYLAPATMSQLATLEVLFAAGFTALLLGEYLSAPQVLGGSIMLIGVLTAQFFVARYKSAKAGEA